MVVMEHRTQEVKLEDGGVVEVFNITPKNGHHEGRRVVTIDIEGWEDESAGVLLTTEEAVRVASALLTEVGLVLESEK